MRHLKILIVLMCFAAVGNIAFAQTWNKTYNLDLSSKDNWGLNFLNSGTICQLDTTQVVNGKHPFHVLGDSNVIEYYNTTDFQMWGHVLLPEVRAGSECELSVILRADTLSAPIRLDAEVVDRNENVVASSHSSVKHLRGVWQEQTVKLSGLAKLNELRIALRYQGKSRDREEFWIDRFVIRINGENIGEWNVAERLPDATAILDPKHTVPLDFDNDKADIPSCISGLDKQRFIALGASTYGSLSIQKARLHMCRDLIRKHGVCYLIFEADMMRMLALDLYVNGYDLNNIDEFLDYYEAKDPFAGSEFIRFVEWVREYNRTRKHKVHLFGLNYLQYDSSTQLFDGIMPDRSKDDNNILSILRKLNADDNLQKTLGNDMFKILINTIIYSGFDVLKFGYIDAERTDRIFRYITDLDENIIPQKSRAAVIADCDHVTYIHTAKVPYWDAARFGHLMRERYGDDYFSIAFLPGRGEYLQDCYPDERGQFADSLQTPVAGSFEDAAMNTGLEYLYYPSAHLDDNTVYMTDIERGGRYSLHYRLRALGKRHDGYIFIRDNRPKEVISPEDLGDWNPPQGIKLMFYYFKRIQRNDFGE